MNELYTRIAAAAEISDDTARTAVGHILSYMQAESDDPAVETMIAETPGGTDALASVGSDGYAGGGIMGLGAKLMGLGLDMGQIRAVAEELVSNARASAGNETVDRAIASVPALAQFV